MIVKFIQEKQYNVSNQTLGLAKKKLHIFASHLQPIFDDWTEPIISFFDPIASFRNIPSRQSHSTL